MTPLESPPSSAAYFVTTRWSVVLSARNTESPQSSAALETLCRNYWFPLYAYVRRRGHNPHDAQDLTQSFFKRLLAKNYLAGVDPVKGKFRSFLLASLQHFLANEWAKARTQKRGGGQIFIPIDTEAAEASYRQEPVESDAEKAFERQWAITLLERTLSRLQEEYVADDKAELFQQLKETLTGSRSSIPYAVIAKKLSTSEGAIKVAAHRLRQRYRETLRAEIADTLAEGQDVEEELRRLFAALGE